MCIRDRVISHENRHDYNPVDVYNNDAELRKVVNQLVDGTYSPNEMCIRDSHHTVHIAMVCACGRVHAKLLDALYIFFYLV